MDEHSPSGTPGRAMPEGPHPDGPTEDDFPGLCRICGGLVPRPDDPNSCTTTLCSERCLRDALVAYWAARGAQATVVLREGYARVERLVRGLPVGVE